MARTTSTSSDPLSRFMNWFSALGRDIPASTPKAGRQDAFSALMNKISG
jgi:hypothetical protein